MSSVVKRNVAAAAPPAPPRDDVEAGYEAAVRPSGDQRSAHLVVAFVLAVAAVVIIVELFVMLSQQQQSFEKAVLEVERMHHGGQLDPAHHQALSSLSRNPLHGNSEFDAAMHEKIAVAEDHRPYFALLDNDDAIMSKVKEMFTNMGYRQLHPWQDYIGKWEVLWAWRDPYHKSRRSQQVTPRDVRDFQLINHFPGAHFTTKADLVKDFNYDFIPPAFLFPSEEKKWREYIRKHKGADKFVWVRKNTGHRGVVVTDPNEAKSYIKENPKSDIFVQRFVYPPHLIEKHKWDIGVYVLITSLDPLRVYYYNDLLVRFCKEPFPARLDPSAVDTYVIADDYTSPWDFEPFQRYKGQSRNVKQWMDRYFAAKAPKLDWPKHLQFHTANAIRTVINQDVNDMLQAAHKWPNKSRQFFELFRFDFVFDDKLNPFLMEVNMSPNLSPSAHRHLSDMFGRILKDLGNVTGLGLGKGRRTTTIDEKFERAHRGDWILIEEE